MRSDIKRLLSLIESDDWVFHDEHFHGLLGCIQYRPQGKSYPRVSYFGVAMDEKTIISFDIDEGNAFLRVSERKRTAKYEQSKRNATSRLSDWLSSYLS
jgi:hypothetical protein